MIVFVIVAVIIIVMVILQMIKWSNNNNSTGVTSVPGLSPSSEINGNRDDIGLAGSLHEFLIKLHGQFGPIASFWLGKKQVVSIASPELFKEHHNIFDRPVELFELFKPLIGKESIQFTNGTDGKNRRRLCDRAFAYEMLPKYALSFQKVVDEIEQKWLRAGTDDQIPATEYTNQYAIKCALQTVLGNKFEDDSIISNFKAAYDITWTEMESRLADPTIPDDESPRGKKFNAALNYMKSIVKQAVEARKERNLTKEGSKLIDILIQTYPDEATLLSEAMTYLTGGYHTTANVLSWGLYFLANNKDAQEKLSTEIKEILGENETIDATNFSDFKYLIQVIDESLRCAVVAPWAARFQDCDSRLGNYIIPAYTPVIHALGVVLQDENIWPEPKKFDPNRFSEENLKGKTPYSFPFFGFAGKHKCPAYKFSYWEAAVFLATLVRRFNINLCGEQVVKPVYGLVTHPDNEIWIQVKKRS